uniref:RING-type E3 ubiquitin transferase n=1 Tax=Branchiostoma floridae TaxID=7739 RepID=C3YHZ0_BRAFL|eukprot:XP_002604116.1 hypothetical protein BRAFLDRAFT_71596 [Branchiostoma floridae]
MGSAPSGLKREVHEELSCSICLELFTRSKVLPCQHTFCQNCLQDHAGRGGAFQCPICRRQVRLPTQGVAGLPDNLMAANMCEKLQKQENHLEEIREQPQSRNRCSFHPTEEVKLYCKQCNVPVCTECCEEDHDGHPTTGLRKAAHEMRSTVQPFINEGRNIMENYLSFIRSLGGKEKTLNEQKQQRDNSIIQAYNQMVQKLTERRDHLLSESGENHTNILDRIQTERDRVLADVNELSAACDRAEQELQQGWVKFLSQQTALTEVLGKYRGKAAPTPVQTQPAVFEPTDTPVPVLGYVTIQSLPSTPIPAEPAPIPAEPAPIPAEPAPITAEPAPITAEPAPITAAPASSNDAARGTGHHHGNQTHQPQKVTFGERGSGTGQFWDPVGVTVSDEGEIFVADRENQRIQVFTLQGTFVRQFSTVVSGEKKIYPDDVAMDGEGNLWVVGRTRFAAYFAVQYNKLGEVLRKFALQKTGWYKGVAVDTRRNHILIATTKTKGQYSELHEALATIREAPASGNGAAGGTGHHHGNQRRQPHKVTFGERGMGTGQFDNPHGVTVSDEGEIFVSDCRNQRIQVFTLQGTFVRQFPTVVSGDQKMQPQGVAMDGEGNLWVVSDLAPSHFAVQYNKQGRVLRKFDLQQTGRHRRVAVDTRRNHILITQTTGDWPNLQGEVLVYRPDRALVRTVGQQQGIKCPQFITVNGEGNILVSDSENHCVYVYNVDGQFLFQFGGEGSGEGQLKFPHGICTDRAGNIIVADWGNSSVEMFDKTGKFLKTRTLLLKHISTYVNTDMSHPCAVAMATQGQLVVTDLVKNKVSIFQNF